MTEETNFEKVRQIFINYLQAKKHRKTPERFMILKEIYNTNEHFDIETLYLRMKNNRYRVSRATLYNTMELLLDCNLVTKHQFGQNAAQYEKAYKFNQHDHLICIDCGKVFEFYDARINDIQKSVEEQFGFTIENHSLAFYGRCKNKKSDGTCNAQDNSQPKNINK